MTQDDNFIHAEKCDYYLKKPKGGNSQDREFSAGESVVRLIIRKGRKRQHNNSEGVETIVTIGRAVQFKGGRDCQIYYNERE